MAQMMVMSQRRRPCKLPCFLEVTEAHGIWNTPYTLKLVWPGQVHQPRQAADSALVACHSHSCLSGPATLNIEYCPG